MILSGGGVAIILHLFKAAAGALSIRTANALVLKRGQAFFCNVPHADICVSRRDASCWMCGRYASGLPAVVLQSR